MPQRGACGLRGDRMPADGGDRLDRRRERPTPPGYLSPNEGPSRWARWSFIIAGLIGLAAITALMGWRGFNRSAGPTPSTTVGSGGTTSTRAGPPSSTVRGGPSTTLPPAGPDSQRKYEDLIKEELRDGSVVYNAPDKMHLGHTELLEVRLAWHLTPENRWTGPTQHRPPNGRNKNEGGANER
jgi:hypothetical protein